MSKTADSWEELEIVDFNEGRNASKIIFQFDDGSKIYANKMILCQRSPVLNIMLTTENFKERDQNVINLPEKECGEFVKLMEVLHLQTKPITGFNLHII